MNLIERAKSILLQPKAAWATIDTEATDTATLFTRYAMVLAVGFGVGMSLIGMFCSALLMISKAVSATKF